jgi:hypothetical protein
MEVEDTNKSYETNNKIAVTIFKELEKALIN